MPPQVSFFQVSFFQVSFFDVAATLIVITAVLAMINERYLKLPSSVGLTFLGGIVSLTLLAANHLAPGANFSQKAVVFLAGIDFKATLMDGMLSFLLFAGALHVDWAQMRQGRWTVLVLSTFGVVFSTLLVGFGLYYGELAFGITGLPLIWCLVFGALISPTDPVAVIASLKHADVPALLRATVACESLFNDGVGIVVFAIILAGAAHGEAFSFAHAGIEFLQEAGGGAALGLAVGWLGFAAMRSVDEHNVEVMISLAIVMGGYSLAQKLSVSGPVAMAVAGILIGNANMSPGFCAKSREFLTRFWDLLDEIFNAVLFLLIGLKIITLPHDLMLWVACFAAVPVVLLARALSVGLPMLLLRPFAGKAGAPAVVSNKVAFPILIWGGLRGGISIAMALSLPDVPERTVVITATYACVLFSVLAQGGTINALIRRLSPPIA